MCTIQQYKTVKVSLALSYIYEGLPYNHKITKEIIKNLNNFFIYVQSKEGTLFYLPTQNIFFPIWKKIYLTEKGDGASQENVYFMYRSKLP